MKALIVGYGSIGRRHVANLRTLVPDAHVTAVRREPAPTPTQVDRVVTDLDAALREEPDIVFVTSPATHHVTQAIQAARAGAHLFIEKPLAASLDHVDELRDAIAGSGVVALVAYPFRFYAPLVAVHEAIEAGRIGTMQSLRAEVGMYLPRWRPEVDYRDSVSASRALGGGALRELSHELDLARWLGGEVRHVDAVTRKISDLELDVEDLAEVILAYESGAVGSVHVDMTQRVSHRALRVCGDRGTITWSWQTHTARIWTTDSEEWKVLHDGAQIDPNDMYLSELEHFLRCVRQNEAPAVTVDDGVAALALVEAAERASEIGTRVQVGGRPRRAVITGGCNEFGLMVARALATHYAPILTTRSADKAAAFAIEHDVDARALNLDDFEAIETFFAELDDVDVLVNAAVARFGSKDNDDYDWSEWERELQVNVGAAYKASVEAARGMARRGFGRIVNVGSIYGRVAVQHDIYPEGMGHTHVVYSVSKAAVAHMTRELAAMWASQGVTVNCISFGGIAAGQPEEFVSNYNAKVPMGRMGTYDELAPALRLATDPANSYMTGQELMIDGGLTIW